MAIANSYFGARYYDSDLSVWLSVDPLSDKYPSTSPYMYCAGNPIIIVDPNGRDIEPTDELSESALNNYVNSFGTEKMSGEKLFGLKKQENGRYTSSLKSSEKKFNKRLNKAGVSEARKEEAMQLYKTLQSCDVLQLRTVSDNEEKSTFYNKGTPIGSKDFPSLFVTRYKSINRMEGVDKVEIATAKSFSDWLGAIEPDYSSVGSNWGTLWDFEAITLPSGESTGMVIELSLIFSSNGNLSNSDIQQPIQDFAIRRSEHPVKMELDTKKHFSKLLK